MALFLVMSFAGQLTGGHCNPAITTSLLISKGNKITPIIAVVYIVSQYVGAIAGGGIVYALIDAYTCPNPYTSSETLAQAFGGELMGSFFVCLFLLIIVHDTTTFLRSNFWNYILVPIVFYIAREYFFACIVELLLRLMDWTQLLFSPCNFFMVLSMMIGSLFLPIGFIFLGPSLERFSRAFFSIISSCLYLLDGKLKNDLFLLIFFMFFTLI